MSEVKKWYIGEFGGEAQARPCSPAEFEIIHASEGRYFVLAENYDSAVQCFLTAAEGCVAAERRERALQQRLTAADDKNDTLTTAYLSAGVREHLLRLRVDVLEGLLREVVVLDPRGEFLGWQLDGKIDAALKPAEGGGSTCNQIREESGLPINHPCKACGVGACIDR